MGLTWAVVMQVLFLSLLMIPGVRGVQSWYLVISQVPVWYFIMYRNNAHAKEKIGEATKLSGWICVATIVLSFVQWGRCTTAVDCSAMAISTAVSLAVAIGLLLSNVHVYDVIRAEK